MAKNIKRHITHIKSNVVENNKPKLPQADDINFGEIAVNYADGYETISIKTVKPDNTPSITPFSSDEYYTKQKLGNDFTGVNSGRTVTDALSAMDTKKTDVSAFTAHTASTVHMDPTEKTNLDSLATNIGTISGITSQMVSNWNTASANTHTHDNKTILDNIAQSDVNHWNDAYGKEHTHSNKNVLDSVSDIKVSNWDTAYNNNHTHSNKAVLDNIGQPDMDHWNDAYDKEHTHSNKGILDDITAAYTTEEKNKLSGIADGAQVNVIETVKVNGTALTPSSKAVDVTVPTKTSELTNNSNFVSDASYVHTDNNYTTPEKNKLGGISAGAEVNQNAFSNIKVDDVTVSADSKTDTVTLIGGGIVSIEANNSNDSITISASNAVTSVAGKAGAVTLDKSDVGLNNVDNTADAVKKVASAATAAVAESVNWNNIGGKPSSFTPSAHNHASNEVTAMTGYVKASAEAAISASDTLNVAIGKLEKGLDGKQPTGNYAYKSDLSNFFDRAEYEMSGSSHVINFYHGNTLIDTIDADVFIKDGMVDNVVISGGNLVITFNTDSGKQPITIPLTDIFNPDNYYTKSDTSGKTEIQNALNVKTDTATTAALNNVVTAHTGNTDIHVTTGDKATWNTVTGKVNTSDIVTAITTQTSASTNPIATSVVANAHQTIAAAINDLNESVSSAESKIEGKQDTLVSGTNIKTINNTSILGSGNIDIQGGSTYSAGRGISISNNQISVSLPISAGTGVNSIIEGSETTANGESSHAEGDTTKAFGNYSHAEGYITIANGDYSHAEGDTTIANGDGSHAEGSGTTAGGNASHAEGSGTTASGLCSHAEGYETIASGVASHAEGYDTRANGDQSHAEGYVTRANGESSHAEGYDTRANGESSHAEGDTTKAFGNYSHAEGYDTTASGSSSHAEGETTIASGVDSHAEGYEARANGPYSHAEGYDTRANGPSSHAEGDSTIASGSSSHAEGHSTTANGEYSHAEGDGTTASGVASHAEGSGTTASGSCSHAEGNYTTASGSCSHAEGESTTASGIDSHAEGTNTIASGDFSHSEGLDTMASGESSHAEGDSTLASGSRSHAEGDGTRASGDCSHAEGKETAANGYASHAEGYVTTANNASEHACGQFNVSSSASTAFGNSGNTLFSVGNGTSLSARHNAFEIRQNGTLIISIENTTLTLDETKLNKLIQLLN